MSTILYGGANHPLEATVVIPTRDRWAIFSGAALPAALGQENINLEVVVVDDGSADGTADRLPALDDPRLRVLRHERSLGVARARNAGIEAARGEWIAFLDDDDIWSPRKLQTQIDAGTAAGGAFVYAGVLFLDERKRFLFGHAPPDPESSSEHFSPSPNG